jgi:hypothetical protein
VQTTRQPYAYVGDNPPNFSDPSGMCVGPFCPPDMSAGWDWLANRSKDASNIVRAGVQGVKIVSETVKPYVTAIVAVVGGCLGGYRVEPFLVPWAKVVGCAVGAGAVVLDKQLGGPFAPNFTFPKFGSPTFGFLLGSGNLGVDCLPSDNP